MSAIRNTVLRMALAAMAADISSPLSREQRIWIIALASRTTPLTCAERAKLRGPLIAWVRDRMPRCVAIIARQFAEEEPDHDRDV